MKKMKHLATPLLALLLSAPAFAADKAGKVPDPMAPGLTGPQKLQALVDRVRHEQKQLKTLEARFVQQQESSMLAEPEESSGVFSYAAPDRVRWEYLKPTPITVVIRGEQMTTWYKDLKRAETLKIGRYSNQVFKYLGASGSLDTLLQYFVVRLAPPKAKGEPFRLELDPKYARIKKRLKGMTIWIDSERYFPTHLKYVEADGDVTEYQLRDLKMNPQIPEDRFVLSLPKGTDTKVIDLGREPGEKSRP